MRACTCMYISVCVFIRCNCIAGAILGGVVRALPPRHCGGIRGRQLDTAVPSAVDGARPAPDHPRAGEPRVPVGPPGLPLLCPQGCSVWVMGVQPSPPPPLIYFVFPKRRFSCQKFPPCQFLRCRRNCALHSAVARGEGVDPPHPAFPYSPACQAAQMRLVTGGGILNEKKGPRQRMKVSAGKVFCLTMIGM